MIYITGDTHGDFHRFEGMDLKEEDLVIILGDVGLNYFLDMRADLMKQRLSKYPCTFFFVRGNHEARPQNVPGYEKIRASGIVTGDVFVQKEYPRFLFADEGIYEIGGRRSFVTNGAYSIDKYYRLVHGLNWFEDEELSDEEMETTLELAQKAGHVDFVFSHTCPAKYIPRHTFKVQLDQSKISIRMEEFLDRLEEVLDYDKWYCGHYHTEWSVDRMRFLYFDIIELR